MLRAAYGVKKIRRRANDWRERRKLTPYVSDVAKSQTEKQAQRVVVLDCPQRFKLVWNEQPT